MPNPPLAAVPERGPRAEFAKKELNDRAADAPPPPPADAPLPSDVAAAPLPARDPVADALDAGAVLRCLNVTVLLLGARRHAKPSPERASRLHQRRERAASRSERLGPRIGPRLGRWIGDWLLAVGLVAEFIGEAVDDELDEVESELRDPKQQELPFEGPNKGNAS